MKKGIFSEIKSYTPSSYEDFRGELYTTWKDDEFKNIILYKNLDYKNNQKFIKITSNCFKDICIRSTTKKGSLMRKYYIELDELFKKFHLDKIENIFYILIFSKVFF